MGKKKEMPFQAKATGFLLFGGSAFAYGFSPEGQHGLWLALWLITLGGVGALLSGAFKPSGDSPGTVYVIQDKETGLYKIGRTTNMQRRMRELGVGKTARLITSKSVGDAPAVEKAAHQRYKANRLPQTEYFKLGSPPAI